MNINTKKIALFQFLLIACFGFISACKQPSSLPEKQTQDNHIATGTKHSEQTATPPNTASTADYYWVELGPDNLILARAIILNGHCPAITIDSTSAQMLARSTPPPGFSSAVLCEHPIPATARSASIGNQVLSLPKASPTRIVVVGDTGCRVKGTDIQDCTGKGTGEVWDFAQVAAAISASKPDVILHVGDYHYREYGTCTNHNCIQSNIGYTWPSWKADFFDPAKNILAQAPWVFIRGNHEDCSRAWKGWFYFLDPHPLPNNPWSNCQDYTDPYQLMLGNQQVIVMDTAVIPDDYKATPNPAALQRYTAEFNTVEKLTAKQTSSWLSTHRPIWAVASFTDSGKPAIAATDLTLQQAIAASAAKALPTPPINTLLTGHIHLFEMLTFNDNRPTQLVFGGGATELDPAITQQLLNSQTGINILQSLGVTQQELTVLHDISFGVLDKNTSSCGWRVDVLNSQGQSLDNFTIGC